MQPEPSRQNVTAERVLAGYLASVTIGTLVFVLLAMLSRVASFESATNNSLATKAIHFVVMLVLMFAVSWMFAIGITALPCAALSLLARAFRIRNWIFYLLAGIALGMLAVRAHIEFFNSVHWYTDPPDEKDVTWLQGLFSVGRFLVPSGAVGGMLFWRIAGKHYRSTDAKSR